MSKASRWRKHLDRLASISAARLGRTRSTRNLEKCSEAIEGCLTAAGNPAVAAVAVSNQRESAVAWVRRTGEPIGPLVSWQCRRSSAFCEDLRQAGMGPTVLERTGLPLDPMFTASKIRWLLENSSDGQERAADGEICVGTVDSWLLWNLTGGRVHQCDMTNASRTQLFNIHTLDWDDELLEVFGVPRVSLPEVRSSSSHFGDTVALGPLTSGTPVGSLIGDSHGAMYGHGRYEPGTVKATYGTGGSLMSPISEVVISQHGWQQRSGGLITRRYVPSRKYLRYGRSRNGCATSSVLRKLKPSPN